MTRDEYDGIAAGDIIQVDGMRGVATGKKLDGRPEIAWDHRQGEVGLILSDLLMAAAVHTPEAIAWIADPPRTVKLKPTADGRLTLQNPAAKVGCKLRMPGRDLVMTIAIERVPAELPLPELCKMASGTIMLKLNNWMVANPTVHYDDVPAEALTYDFSQLGVGRIAR